MWKFLELNSRFVCCADSGTPEPGGGGSVGSGGSSSGGGSTSSQGSGPASPSSGAAPTASTPTPAATAPVSSPSAEPATPGAATGGEDPFDFNEMLGGVDPFEAPEASIPLSPPTSGQPAAPAAPPVQPPATPTGAAPAAPAAQTPVEGQPAQPQAPAGTAAQSPPLDPSDPFALVAAMRQNEQAAVDFVAQSLFALSAEDKEALETDTLGTIPKLFARAFVKSQVNNLELLGNLIPQMIVRHMANMKKNDENSGKFYQRWPDIKKDTHGDLVNRYGVTYRKMHPNASMEQMIEDLGPMIMMAARIVPSLNPGTGTHAQPNGGGPSPKPQPAPGFIPAATGTAGVGGVVEQNVWEGSLAPHE